MTGVLRNYTPLGYISVELCLCSRSCNFNRKNRLQRRAHWLLTATSHH